MSIEDEYRAAYKAFHTAMSDLLIAKGALIKAEEKRQTTWETLQVAARKLTPEIRDKLFTEFFPSPTPKV